MDLLKRIVLGLGLCGLLVGGGAAEVVAGEDPVEQLLATSWAAMAARLKAREEPAKVDLLIEGQPRMVELLEVDGENCLVYKLFGRKSQLAFTQATGTQIAGILQVLIDDEDEAAAGDHLNVGLLLIIEGRSMESATEINKALSLDNTLSQEARERMKLLPRPAAPGTDHAAAMAAHMKVGEGGGYKATPAGVNHEGRQLGAMPKLTASALFNTPQADQVMAALQVFPKNNPWNEDISKLPVHPDSDKIVEHIGADKHIHFNQDMNFVIVPPDQPRINLEKLQYQGESDPGPYPIPDNMPIEGYMKGDLAEYQRTVGGDAHAIVVDPYRGIIYEFYQASTRTGKWTASCEATFDLNSNQMRPVRWTSADAAGLPIFPAIVRYDECERGRVEHALRFTVRHTRPEYIYPARHVASLTREKYAAAMGQRFRLKANVNLPGLPKHAQAILYALKKYGMFVADNGSDWYLSSTSDARIEGLRDLQQLKGSDFEVVQTTPETGAAGR